jgi:hypothetical protein
MDRNGDAGYDLLQQAQAGRDAAAGKLTAEFDAVGSATICDLCVVQGFNANLELG